MAASVNANTAYKTYQSAYREAASSALLNQLLTAGYVPNAAFSDAPGNDILVMDALANIVACLPVSYTNAWTPSAVVTISAPEQTVTLTGVTAATTDRVIVSYPGAPTANVGICSARVSTGGLNCVVSVQFVNPTAGSLTPPSGNYTFTFIRS